MGYAVYYDNTWERFSGYGVPAKCEHPRCGEEPGRGIEQICGESPGGAEYGCGMTFCGDHLLYCDAEDGSVKSLCARCQDVLENDADFEPFAIKPELREWTDHIATDPSWAQWREQRAM